MGRATDYVRAYAQEDGITISKHWIVFVKTGIGIVLRVAVTLFVLMKWTNYIKQIGTIVNDFFPALTFDFGNLMLPIIITLLVIRAVALAYKALEEYVSSSMTIDNVRVHGKVGRKDVSGNFKDGQIGDCTVSDRSLPARLLGYGTLSICISGETYTLKDMKNTEEFQETLSAISEGRMEENRFRNRDERREDMLFQSGIRVNEYSQILGTANQIQYVNAEPKPERIDAYEQRQIEEQGTEGANTES